MGKLLEALAAGFLCWLLEMSVTANVSAAKCFDHESCSSSQDGVRDLDCFQKPKERDWLCTWKAGQRASNKTRYTLLVEQKSHHPCKQLITETFARVTLFRNSTMTAYVVESSGDGKTCTKAKFTGLPKTLVRCSPTEDIYTSRTSGRLQINATWKESSIKQYIVQYKKRGSAPEREALCTEKLCTVGNVSSSAPYDIKVRCVNNTTCFQCPESNVITVPPELTKPPIITKLEIIPEEKGAQLVLLSWKTEQGESVTSYNVNVRKETGEFNQTLPTSQSDLRLLLSRSAYRVSITAANSACTSPAVHRRIPATDTKYGLETLSVHFSSNGSFSVSWKRSLNYSCYSVEWWLRGETPQSSSFYLQSGSSAEIKARAAFQKYKRYFFLLHTRTERDTCNLKHINASETTYSRTEAYLEQGTALSAPQDINCTYATDQSFTVVWSLVPEDELQGFLLGYILYYTEKTLGNFSNSINVSSLEDSFTVYNLKSRTDYQVQMLAVTAAGEGVLSPPVYCRKKPVGSLILIGAASGVFVGFVMLLITIHICSKMLKRVKTLFWPSIPNPGNSNAIQKIDGVHNMDILEPLNKGRLAHIKEADTNSLFIIEEPPSPMPAHKGVESTGTASDTQEPPIPPGASTGAPTVPVGPSDYTTMEHWHQAAAQHFTPTLRPQDYVKQSA